MGHIIARARNRQATRECDIVATEVQDAIARSGMSRAQLATCLGTSTSRVPKVTPSPTSTAQIRHVLGEIRVQRTYTLFGGMPSAYAESRHLRQGSVGYGAIHHRVHTSTTRLRTRR